MDGGCMGETIMKTPVTVATLATFAPATAQTERHGYSVAVIISQTAAANDEPPAKPLTAANDNEPPPKPPTAANDNEPPPKPPALVRRVLSSVVQFAGIVTAGIATVAFLVSQHPTEAPPAKAPTAQNDNSKGSEYLRNQRARFDDEFKKNPPLKRELANLIVHENLGARTGVVEALFNRMAMTGGTVAQGMHNGFYGPINGGQVHWTGSAADWKAMRYIDEALAGSNLIQGYTDQGSRGDPNYERGGVGININGERFNDWGGAGSRSTRWRLEQQRHVREGGGAKALPSGGPKGMSGAGHANFMTGTLPSASSMKLVTTSNGIQFRANPKSAPHLQGFVNELEAAGAPITDIGGYNPRHIAGSARWSQHAYGNAVDIDQIDRNQVRAPFGAWAKSHPQAIREAARKYGIISGGDWSNPDFGHFEWGGGSGIESGSRNVPDPGLFTVHQGRRYRATVNLRGVEQWVTDEMIADGLRQRGFTEVEVTGSRAIREAQARWSGPDATFPIDEHLTNVQELPDGQAVSRSPVICASSTAVAAAASRQGVRLSTAKSAAPISPE
jgi:hypothetical protein